MLPTLSDGPSREDIYMPKWQQVVIVQRRVDKNGNENNGRGVFEWAPDGGTIKNDGDRRYEGQFKDNNKHGHGVVYYWVDGRKYDGEWIWLRQNNSLVLNILSKMVGTSTNITASGRVAKGTVVVVIFYHGNRRQE